MWNRVSVKLNTIVILTILVAMGCSTLAPKILSKDQVKVIYSGLFIRPFDVKPTTWVTVELTNNSDKTFVTRTTRVVDVTNGVILYGAEAGYQGSGFNSNPEVSWPIDLKTLEPGKIGYVSVNIGNPMGPIIEMRISLKSTDNHIATETVSINLEGVVPVNQMPGDK